MPSVQCCVCNKWIKVPNRRHRRKVCITNCVKSMHYSCYSCAKNAHDPSNQNLQHNESVIEVEPEVQDFQTSVENFLTADVLAILGATTGKRGRPKKTPSTLNNNTVRKKMKVEIDAIKGSVEQFDCLLQQNNWDYQVQAELTLMHKSTQKVSSYFGLNVGRSEDEDKEIIDKLAFIKTK